MTNHVTIHFSNPAESARQIDQHPQLSSRRARLRHRQPLSSETGGTMVEASVAMTLLLMCIFGIMDCSRALYVNHYVRYSAEEAARYAMVRGSTWNNAVCTSVATESCTATAANINTFISSITPAGIDTGNSLSVVTTWTGKTPSGAVCSSTNVNNSPGCVVQVQIKYSFNFTLPFLPANAVQMGSTSAVAISQ